MYYVKAEPRKAPSMEKEKLLLHSCCGPCSTACIERLIPDYDVTVFYYNPCINDAAEYEKRKANQKKFIEAVNEGGVYEDADGCRVGFAEGAYEPEEYETLVKGLEDEPEGGARCAVCFRQRLTGAAKYAKEHGFAKFTTTLTVSPHKNYRLISEIGRECAEAFGIEYLPYDFKKKDGFRRSVELSKECGLYRQDYCGCSFSKR